MDAAAAGYRITGRRLAGSWISFDDVAFFRVRGSRRASDGRSVRRHPDSAIAKRNAAGVGRLGFDGMQQLAVPIHQMRTVGYLLADPKSLFGGLKPVGMTVRRAEEFHHFGWPGWKVGAPHTRSRNHRKECPPLHHAPPRIRTRLRSMAARFGTPASPISSASSVRSNSMTRSTPAWPNAANPYK